MFVQNLVAAFQFFLIFFFAFNKICNICNISLEECLITGFHQRCGICDPVITVLSKQPVNLILCKSMSACIKNTGGIFCRKIPVIRMKHIVKLIMEFCPDLLSGPPKNRKEPVTDI